MNQKYSDKLRQHWNQNRAEWDQRILKCATRLVSAVCFRESAYATYHREKQDVILPTIGYYYGLFHMGTAMLSIDYQKGVDYTTNDSDRGLRYTHTQLEKGLQLLVQCKVLPKSITDTLERWKKLREEINYPFRFRPETPDGGDVDMLFELDANAHDAMNSFFSESLKFIGFVSEEIKKTNSLDIIDEMRKYNQTAGSDLIFQHLSVIVGKKVMEYLEANGFM